LAPPSANLSPANSGAKATGHHLTIAEEVKAGLLNSEDDVLADFGDQR
jgi:hypothetical protein